ncbi:serum response factor-like [Anguilla rostrata]|uniref:serum response factor-like n=1 Tax=Anguilla rostrata TaxID=7938 RepID=UPI0030CCFEB1
MLPSQAGSAPTGNGSASGTGNIGHGSGIAGTGIRPSLVSSGLNEVATGFSGSHAGGAGRSGDGSGMLGGNGAGVGSRGVMRPGNGAGLTTLQNTAGVVGGINTGIGTHGGGRFDPDRQSAPQVYSCSEADSDSGDDDDPMGSAGDSRRGVKRERPEMEAATAGPEVGIPPGGYGGVAGGVAGAKPGKKTRGRVKIKMEFIDNKLRRYTTFSKRKTGIMKKAYELSTLTGTQVLLLVASETGHVYTFATRKLQPMITSETGKALIQTCLNSPDSPPRSDPSTDQRMSATGFEETDLTYQVSESDSCGEAKVSAPRFLSPSTSSRLPLLTSLPVTVALPCCPGLHKFLLLWCLPGLHRFLLLSFPVTFVYLRGRRRPQHSRFTHVRCSEQQPVVSHHHLLARVGCPPVSLVTCHHGILLKTTAPLRGVKNSLRRGRISRLRVPPPKPPPPPGGALPPGTPAIPLSQLQQHPLQAQTLTAAVTAAQNQQVFRFPAGLSLTGGGMAQQLQAIQVHPTTQQSSVSTSDSSPEISQPSSSSTVSVPATIVTSSVPTSMAGHMMYPSPHAVMYASAPTLSDGSLAVLNAFSQGPSHQQGQDTGAVPQVFLAAGPPGTVQIPVSAVQLHSMVIGQQSGGSSSNLTELQVVNLDAPHNAKNE